MKPPLQVHFSINYTDFQIPFEAQIRSETSGYKLMLGLSFIQLGNGVGSIDYQILELHMLLTLAK